MVNTRFFFIVLFSVVVLACATKQEKEPKALVRESLPERLEQAAVALNSGDITKAQSLYQEVIEDLLADEINLSDGQEENKKSRKADRKKNKDDEIDPELKQDYLSTAYTGMGVIAEQAGNFPAARDMFNAALTAEPDNISAQEGVALVTLNEGRKEEAKQLLNEVMEKTADAPRWRTLNALGVIADLEENYSEAESYYRKSFEAGGPEEQALNNQGYSQLMAGKLSTALKTFSDAHTRFPGSERITSNLALTMARMGKYEQARKTWAKTLKEEEAWNNAGYVAMLKGDLTVARQYLEKAIELAPRYYQAAENSLERVKQLEAVR